MKIHISKGNSKLHKIPNISLPPRKSCPPGVPCHKDCYAWKFYYLWQQVRTAWDENLAYYKEYPYQYYCNVANWIINKQPEWFRWHVAGDIPDQHYYDLMWQIAHDVPDTKFLVFTKNFELKFHRTLDNFTVVASMWPGWGDPEIDLPKAWMQDGTETRIPGDALECPGNCENCAMCWHLKELHRDVVFHKH